ncbi:hypothetical protein IQ22_01853 [Pseudomonas duriflava]|uniref:Uncharacterized protein n=1 Tax=Pseudomonas duriflava TaxID=459528 RepID=A0A562QDW6_9PSED|nr:hypothetical protein IQ22_01853 [Pseudomonas duriflava]
MRCDIDLTVGKHVFRKHGVQNFKRMLGFSLKIRNRLFDKNNACISTPSVITP